MIPLLYFIMATYLFVNAKVAYWILDEHIEASTFNMRHQDPYEPRPRVIVNATEEHRTPGQTGFNQTRDTGSGDDDNGKADGDHNHDESHHGGKSSWKELLQQLHTLRAEFLAIKEGPEHDSTPDQIKD